MNVNGLKISIVRYNELYIIIEVIGYNVEYYNEKRETFTTLTAWINEHIEII